MSVNEKMTAIADAIREKTGKTEVLGLDAMAESIGEVYEAGQKSEYDRFWDAYQQNGALKYCPYLFAGDGWASDVLKPKYPIKLQGNAASCEGMFKYHNRTLPASPVDPATFADLGDVCDMIDFSACTAATEVFNNARVKNIKCDFSNCTTLTRTFECNNGGGIDNITLTVTEKCTLYPSAFNGAKYLKTITFTEDSTIAASINFQHSTLLTKDSIESVINALLTTASGKTLTLSKNAKETAFTADEWATLIATKSNWTISLV